MSDGELRDLERRWRASGAVEDEARWHVARVRAGALEPERLALAAWTGSPGAVLAAQDEAKVAGTTSWVRRLFGGATTAVDPTAPLTGGLPALARWLDAGLQEAPFEAQRRAALAEVERVVVHLAMLAQEELPTPEPQASTLDHRVAEVRLRLRAWAAAARAVLRDAAHAATEALLEGRTIEPPARLEWLDGPPHEAVHEAAAWPATTQAACTAGRAKRVGRSQGWWTSYGGRGARRLTGPEAQAWAEQVRAAQRAALAPWALGLGDPLRERAASALDRVDVASPCPEAWDAMRRVDDAGRVRACDRCQLQVHDISALSRVEAEALLAAHAGRRLCGRIYRRADGRVQTRDCGPAIDALIDQGAPRHELGGTVGIIAGPLAAPGEPE